MLNLHRLLPILALSMTLAACATAANKTEAVGNDTGHAAGEVGHGVVSVIEWPFHVVADLL